MLDVQIGDVLTMKKNHPCGENRFLGCCREVMVPRSKVEKNIRKIFRAEEHT